MGEMKPPQIRRLGPKAMRQNVDITKVGGSQMQNIEGFDQVHDQLNTQEQIKNRRTDTMRTPAMPKRQIPGKTKPPNAPF